MSAATTTGPGIEPPRRRPGRPRDTKAREAILEATMALLAEVGFAGVTVDAVAARAGVGKATIYRRWESKERLVLDAITTTKEPLVAPDTGSVEGDLVALYGGMADGVSNPSSRSLLAAMLAQATVDEEVERKLQQLTEDRKDVSRQVLRRGIERGELPADTDVDLVVDLLAGAILYRACFVGRTVGRRKVERLVRTVLAGTRNTGDVG